MTPSRTFPKPGRFEIRSLPLFLVGDGERDEVLVCKAEMVVQTKEAYSMGGRRQVDLEVVEWVATGTSRLLGGKVEFRQTKPLKSWVRTKATGTDRGADFPAQARFAMRYQVTTPQGTVRNLTGVATGVIRQFPPKGDVFAVQKTLAFGSIRVTPVACACPADQVVISIPESLSVVRG